MFEFWLTSLHVTGLFARMVIWQSIFVIVILVNWMYCLEFIKFDVSNTSYYVENGALLHGHGKWSIIII